jgi:hypothetical protein
MSQTSDFRQIRGKVFFRKSTRELVFQVDKTFLTASALRELVVRSSKALGVFDVSPDALDQNVLIKLWSIATIADVRKSTLLARSAKNAIEETFAKAKLQRHMRFAATQGLTKQLVPFHDDPHPFGHPALQQRFVVFHVFINGCVECTPALHTWDYISMSAECDRRTLEEVSRIENILKSTRPEDMTPSKLHALRTADADRRAKACSVCRKRAKLRCECCGLRFCGVACQRTRHKG